jgi:hypothetical protein
MVIDLKHWNAFQTFTCKQAACLIAGLEPSHQTVQSWANLSTELWSKVLMEEHYKNALVFSHTGGFDPKKYGDLLLPTDLQSVDLERLRLKVNALNYEQNFWEWARSEGNIEQQKFSRFELSRWINVMEITSAYLFDLSGTAKSSSVQNAIPNQHPTAQLPVVVAEQRQAARWQACIDAGLKMPIDTYAQYPKGINEVARSLGIKRQTLTGDLNKYRERKFAR